MSARRLHRGVPALVAALVFASTAVAQQVVDTTFVARVAAPVWPDSGGPLVLVDEGHHNAHTIDGSYRPFADLLRADGFRVEPVSATFTREVLDRAAILVVINAIAAENEAYDDWVLPTYPAFTDTEVEAVYEWVLAGGSLLLVADHMPFPGAAYALARRFGVEFTDGFAIDTLTWSPLVFRRSDGTLAAHAITDGRDPTERIDSVATFWGQAFRVVVPGEPEPGGVVPGGVVVGAAAPGEAAVNVAASGTGALMIFAPGVISYRPERAWQFTPDTPVDPVGGWLQGLALVVGSGRVVMLGEAGMLTAQLTGPRQIPAGMNHRWAEQNAQFALNIMRWLARAH